MKHTLTEAAVEGFRLGEESTTKEARKFICKTMVNILETQSVAKIHAYCARMIVINAVEKV